jgi:hypothetical protein
MNTWKNCKHYARLILSSERAVSKRTSTFDVSIQSAARKKQKNRFFLNVGFDDDKMFGRVAVESELQAISYFRGLGKRESQR